MYPYTPRTLKVPYEGFKFLMPYFVLNFFIYFYKNEKVMNLWTARLHPRSS